MDQDWMQRIAKNVTGRGPGVGPEVRKSWYVARQTKNLSRSGRGHTIEKEREEMEVRES